MTRITPARLVRVLSVDEISLLAQMASAEAGSGASG